MNAKERAKIQEALKDARKKIENGKGELPKERFRGMVSAFEWVLMEV